MAKAQSQPSDISTVINRLNAKHPNARYELNWETPLQLLVATILAAQCTDERVNKVTSDLFKKYTSAKDYADADLATLEQDVKPTGFYRNKAKAIQNACKALVENFKGEVPRTMEEMVTLPGVARKTANVVLNTAFKLPTGVIVDSHVARVSQRMGIVKSDKPEQIEQELMQIIPKKEWIQFGPAMVLHGRYTCTAHNPRCEECVFDDICPKKGVVMKKTEKKTDPASKSQSSKKTAEKATRGKEPVQKATGATPADKAVKAREVEGILVDIPADWHEAVGAEFQKPYFTELAKFVAHERATGEVYPPREDVFNSFKYTPYNDVKVLLLGQDPYHDVGQAHGMCFSVRPGVKPPPSLVNMFKELQSDLGCKIPNNGYLVPWAERGVLLLNAVLTVRAHQPNSHKDKGWEKFTDSVIQALNDREDPVVFALWGGYAQKKQKLIDGKKHVVLCAAHPSPLSMKKYMGSKPFSAINNALKGMGKQPIDWQIPDL